MLISNRRRPSQHKEGDSSEDDQQSHTEREPEILSRMAHIAHDAATIMRGDYGEESVADRAAGKDGQKELAYLISEGSGCKQEHGCGTWGRSHCRDKDCSGSPAFKCVLHLARAAGAELILNPCQARLLAELVCEVRANHGSERGHASVIKPQIAMPSRKKSSEDVQTSERGNWGAVDNRERNQSQTAPVREKTQQSRAARAWALLRQYSGRLT